MNYSDYKVMLDIHEIGSQVYLTAKQGDTNRRICASLVESGKPYQISKDCVAVFTAKKPDGNIIFNNCTIADNVITYEITEQTVAAVGEMACELRLYGADNALIVCPRFTLNVVLAVFTDSEIVESTTEISTLTALICEAGRLISDVNSKLDNGEFIPKMSIGTVTTLPAGSVATAEFSGSGAAPVLNLGIPQGEQGQADSLIPDTELSESSTKPVQNRVIAAALIEHEEAAEKALENKVDKEEGKGLSANDFTDAYKQKLDGIEDGANKFALEDGAVTTAKLSPSSVTTDKMANSAATTEKIANSAVTTDKIADENVTVAKLSNDAKEAFAPAYSYGTSDLTAGSSELATGKLHFVYE